MSLEWVVPATPLGAALGLCLLIIRGYLVPPKLVHRDEYDRVRKERDDMTALAMRLLDQNGQLLAGARVLTDVAGSLHPETHSGRP